MNKIAFITGATSGIGRATALKAAETGFDIIITGRRSDRLEALAEEIRQKGVEALPLHFDVRKSVEVQAAIDNLSGKWRNIHVLVNNAGLAVGVNPIQEGILEDWERMIDTNVKGLLYITRAIAPLMIANRCGHICKPGLRLPVKKYIPEGMSIVPPNTPLTPYPEQCGLIC